MSPKHKIIQSKGETSYITWGIAILLLLTIVLFLFNTFVLKGKLPFAKSEVKVTSSEQASQKIGEIGENLQNVGSAIQQIEDRLK